MHLISVCLPSNPFQVRRQGSAFPKIQDRPFSSLPFWQISPREDVHTYENQHRKIFANRAAYSLLSTLGRNRTKSRKSKKKTSVPEIKKKQKLVLYPGCGYWKSPAHLPAFADAEVHFSLFAWWCANSCPRIWMVWSTILFVFPRDKVKEKNFY